MTYKLLLVEDEAASRFGFVRYFSKEGFEIHEAPDLGSAGRALAGGRFDVIVLDVNLPDGNGLDFVSTVRAHDPCIPIIVMTGAADIPLAVDAMRRGADNFVTKPVDNPSLALFLRRTVDIGDLKRKQVARKRLDAPKPVFFGAAPGMAQVLEMARLAAGTDCPVLITGETGTGKGVLARWIHQESGRASEEFVELNCSCLRGEMLARELFGTVRGAYTSADQDRKGLLDIADRGTLFLDEVGDMSLEVQGQLLKVLEEKSYRRLGDVKLLRSDFRLICATNKDPESMVRSGQFRQDLLYRINLVGVHLPPLRQRSGDLAQLASFLLGELGASGRELSPQLLQLLTRYGWPGNIRELRNILERAHLLARGGELRPEHFPGLEQRVAGHAEASLEELEARHLESVLEQANGSVDEAARRLGMSRATLYRKLKRARPQAAQNP